VAGSGESAAARKTAASLLLVLPRDPHLDARGVSEVTSVRTVPHREIDRVSGAQREHEHARVPDELAVALPRGFARYALDPKSFADDTGDGGEPR